MKNAHWIKPPVDTLSAAMNFKKTFSVEKDILSATAKLSSMGNYVAFFNGQRLGKGVLTPGLTSYNKRIQYFTYDITQLIQEENTLEHTVAPGWAVGYFGYKTHTKNFHENIACIAKIEIRYQDGTEDVIVTDEDWEVYTTSVVMSDIFKGEINDATAVPKKIGNAVFDSISTELIEQVGEDIVENERIAPIELITTPRGERVIDFGQNMTGYIEISLKGNYGDVIEMTCAEVLDSDGNFYTENYRTADSRMTYILDGKNEYHKPLYTFFGFRYIRLDKFPSKEIDPNIFTAIAVHSNMKRLSSFSCGNAKINQLYHNTVWGQKSNYLDIPTDCPQRDERMGWTGDAQVFCRTAALNFDVRKFFKKWLGDMRAEQGENGEIYGVVPEYGSSSDYHTRISAAWGDASVIIPCQLYDIYGDTSFLSDNFEMMKRWADYIHSIGPEEHLWLNGHHYGDWLAMDLDVDACYGATSTDFIASAFYVNTLASIVRAGEILKKDTKKYKELHLKAYNRFREYFMENGMPKKDTCLCSSASEYKNPLLDEGMTQTAIVLILYFKLCLPEERKGLTDKLCRLIDLNGGKMTTGFVGTPYILKALSDNGRSDKAYQLLFNTENPSWLYSVEHGATTMWEHWNGIKEDGSFWSKTMNSFNHYAYGSVFEWIFANAAGIETGKPGFKEIIFQPKPVKELGFVNCTLETQAGTVESNWYYKGERIYFEFSVPQGSVARISLPNGQTKNVEAGIYHYVV